MKEISLRQSYRIVRLARSPKLIDKTQFKSGSYRSGSFLDAVHGQKKHLDSKIGDLACPSLAVSFCPSRRETFFKKPGGLPLGDSV